MVANDLAKFCTNSTQTETVGSCPLHRWEKGGIDGGIVPRCPEATRREFQSSHSRYSPGDIARNGTLKTFVAATKSAGTFLRSQSVIIHWNQCDRRSKPIYGDSGVGWKTVETVFAVA